MVAENYPPRARFTDVCEGPGADQPTLVNWVSTNNEKPAQKPQSELT